MTQNYDDIRRALAHARETAYGTLEGLALHPDQIEALLTDAQFGALVREAAGEPTAAMVQAGFAVSGFLMDGEYFAPGEVRQFWPPVDTVRAIWKAMLAVALRNLADQPIEGKAP